MHAISENALAVVVLAAGGGSRLGGGKLLLPWRGRPIIAHTVATAMTLGTARPVVVVAGHEAGAVRLALRREFGDELAGIRLVDNLEWEEGQSTSLRAGFSAAASLPPTAGLEAILVMLGDQPLVRPATLAILAEAYFSANRDAPPRRAAAPLHNGKRGNPVILSTGLHNDVMQLRGDIGARNILAGLGSGFLGVPVDDAGVLRDIDTPDEYQELKRFHNLILFAP